MRGSLFIDSYLKYIDKIPSDAKAFPLYRILRKQLILNIVNKLDERNKKQTGGSLLQISHMINVRISGKIGRNWVSGI